MNTSDMVIGTLCNAVDSIDRDIKIYTWDSYTIKDQKVKRRGNKKSI